MIDLAGHDIREVRPAKSTLVAASVSHDGVEVPVALACQR
jgi:hypothetical protein